VKRVVRDIDDDLLVAQNQGHMGEVQAATHLVDLLAPHRVLVLEGPLTVVRGVAFGLLGAALPCPAPWPLWVTKAVRCFHETSGCRHHPRRVDSSGGSRSGVLVQRLHGGPCATGCRQAWSQVVFSAQGRRGAGCGAVCPGVCRHVAVG